MVGDCHKMDFAVNFAAITAVAQFLPNLLEAL